MTKMACCQR